MTRKEIFQHEVKTGATIEEIKIYTNSLNLILCANGEEIRTNWDTGEKRIKKGAFLEIEEAAELRKEIKELNKKIKMYERMTK